MGNSLLQSSTAIKVVDGTNYKNTRFEQPSGMTPSPTVIGGRQKTLRCRDLNKYNLINTVIEKLNASTCFTVREYFQGRNKTDLHYLAIHNTSLFP